ncbi:hypothetical protein KOR42_27590 [Thalassoglobus neptunius]|uniref:AsmA-like C-terminal domain-containing protein n=1 Tax=Thalassoglobus neptunius TaxID=1938619 RepID=A0A5C5X0B4_9PLAN|nr:hypothetical protein [Thalassoglobus neptunius]TWT55632.1 hypothetical protein KOR42_27590 [Thalassoglobus neptunius]
MVDADNAGFDEDRGGSESESLPVKKSGWRWIRRGIVSFVLIFLGIVTVGPWIVSRILCDQNAQEWISSRMPGRISISNASFGWQSPISLNDVTLKDDNGNPLADVRSVSANRSFWQMLRGGSAPLEVNLVGLSAVVKVPSLNVDQFEPEKVNLNRAVKDAIEASLPSIPEDLIIHFSESRLVLQDASGAHLTGWDPIHGELRLNRDQTHSFNLTAVVARNDRMTETLPETAGAEIEASYTQSASGRDALSVSLSCQDQPLTGLQPVLEPLAPDLFPMKPATGTMTLHAERSGRNRLGVSIETQFVHENFSTETRLPVDVDLKLDYSGDDDRIRVDRLFAQLDDTKVDLTGEVTDVSDSQNLNVQGTFESPMEAVAKLVPEQIRENIQVEGLKLGELSVRGPLRPDPEQPFRFMFEVTSNVTWDQATAYGLRSDEGNVKLTLLGRDVTLEPVNLPVSGGHIRRLPSLDLSTNPVTVTIPDGLMLDQVALTEEICRDWLQYISPLLSDATSTEGTLSLTPKGGTFQLGKADEADLSGTLQIHRGRVRPGPLANEIVGKVGQVALLNQARLGRVNEAVLMSVDDQEIPYQLVDGRVYHADFNFQVGPVAMTSYGSVGLDKTLDLVVTMAMPEEWANRGPFLQFLAGEAMEFHVVGTLDEPKLDSKPLKDFGKRIGDKAVDGLLDRIMQNRERREPRRRRNRR